MLSASIVSGNDAKGRNVGQGGGGIYSEGALLVVRDTTISSNVAREDGGLLAVNGDVIAEGGRVLGNESLANGGGVMAVDSSIRINAVRFQGNKAGLDPDRTGNGGAINLSGSSRLVAQQTVSFVRGTRFPQVTEFRGNLADEGGALWVGEANSVLLGVATRVIDNQATAGSGGALFDLGHVRTENANFAGNSAEEEGGAIFVDSIGSLQLFSQTEFSDNTANGIGSAVYNAGFTVTRLTTVDDVADHLAGDSIFNSGTLRDPDV